VSQSVLRIAQIKSLNSQFSSCPHSSLCIYIQDILGEINITHWVEHEREHPPLSYCVCVILSVLVLSEV